MATKAKKAKKATKRKATPSTSNASQAPTQVAMILNGNAIGMVNPTGKSIGQVGQEIAREHGLKTYSLLVDGVKVLADGASSPLSGHTSIEVFAKETRGSN